MSDWSSAQYLKFRSERTQPAIDLANRIERPNAKDILDIGCGPGNSTACLKEKFPCANILGIDSSPDMIEAARINLPEAEFRLCDAGSELSSLGKKFDVVFSNACIQWIPDHRSLLPEMFGILNDGGVLAVQVPENYDEPIHKIITETAESPHWRDILGQVRSFHTLTPDEYYELISELTPYFFMWETVYFHRMKRHEDIMEWYRATGLKPYLDVLDEDNRKSFEEEILLKIRKAYPVLKDGEIIFRFPRLFFIAAKNRITKG